MSIARLLRQAAIAVGAVVAIAGLEAGPASAQLFWDWGGGNMVGGSGREVVRFSPKFPKGEVIVSFSDRTALLRHQAGRGAFLSGRRAARAEPLAGRDLGFPEAHKPVLDADTGDDEGEPSAAALGAGRPSHEPAGRAGAVSGLQHVPHPRHGRALDHRHQRVQGLHPHVQSGRAGSLSARQRRHQGDGDVSDLRRCGEQRPE